MIKNFNPKNYILTFKASGINIFVTDIHKNVYKKMRVLFIIHNKTFYQYFPNVTYNKTLNEGLRFYKNKAKVNLYIEKLLRDCKNFKQFYKENIATKNYLSKRVLKTFFKNTIKLCSEYTKMNIEYTEKAFLFKKESKTIQTNLNKTAKLKDKIRSFMNQVLFQKKGYAYVVFNILSK